MNKTKDRRILSRYTTFKEYVILLFMLAGFNGFHMWIYQTMNQSGLLETSTRTVINILMLYVMAMAAVATAIIGLIRYRFFIDPMRKLSEAAGKIAKGDFSVRIPSFRKNKRKSSVDILFDDFNTMAEELASIETLKNDFIANVSHEIKTPLSVIQTYTAALQNENISAQERGENVKTILDAAQKLSALVTNILKLSKLENQEIISEAKLFNLAEQLRRCALSFVELMEIKNITLEDNLQEVDVFYNEDMLEIVWNNILSNALKFTGVGGTIVIDLKVLNDSLHNYVQVCITDTGCGIDETFQKRIFDKFYQCDTSHSKDGNGLGLALVKKTIDLLGGTITVKSAPKQGTAFTICLKI